METSWVKKKTILYRKFSESFTEQDILKGGKFTDAEFLAKIKMPIKLIAFVLRLIVSETFPNYNREQ